jgi:hypothetical protein
MRDLDLFQATEPAPVKTCGTCEGCELDNRKREYFCALSFKTITKEQDACPWWYGRAK